MIMIMTIDSDDDAAANLGRAMHHDLIMLPCASSLHLQDGNVQILQVVNPIAAVRLLCWHYVALLTLFSPC